MWADWQRVHAQNYCSKFSNQPILFLRPQWSDFFSNIRANNLSYNKCKSQIKCIDFIYYSILHITEIERFLYSPPHSWKLQNESIKSIHFFNCPGFITDFLMKYFQRYFFSMLSCIFWYHFHGLMFHAWLYRRQTIRWSVKWLAPKKLIENTC